MSGNIASNESTASGLASVVLNTPDSTYPNGQALSALPTGLLKVTTGTGVLSKAVALTDYLTSGARPYWETYFCLKTGCTPDQVFSYFQDFDGATSGRTNPSGTTVVNAKPTLDGGWVSITAGNGTLSGSYGFLGAVTPDGGAPAYLANPKTSKWLMVMRGKLTTTPGANTKWTIGVNGTTLNAGVIAATSASKYVCVYGATTLTSTISIDTSTHVIVVWSDGALVHLSVDGEADVTGAVTNLPTTANEIQQFLSTNSSEAAQTENVDYFGIVVLRS